MVQVISSPGASWNVSPSAPGHPSPLTVLKEYPLTCVSPSTKSKFVAKVFLSLCSTASSFTVSLKSSGNAVPPLLFVGSFLTVSDASASSSLTMVQVISSPGALPGARSLRSPR